MDQFKLLAVTVLYSLGLLRSLQSK